MKRNHIILILVIVVAIGVVISTFADASTYSDFTEAAGNPQREYHIIGKLNLDKPIEYDPAQGDHFSFYMTDAKGVEKRVTYRGAKPQDFEKSEQVVLVGTTDGDEFRANSLLLKCPSKYDDQEKPNGFGEKTFGGGVAADSLSSYQ